MGSRTFATIGVDRYRTLIQGTSELVRGTRPDGVRDPGDDPGDGRAGRLAELGVGGFSRGLSSRHDGRARDNRIGRSGFPAGRVNIDGMERRRDTSAILWIVVGSSKDEAVAAGNAPASAPVAIKARATVFLSSTL